MISLKYVIFQIGLMCQLSIQLFVYKESLLRFDWISGTQRFLSGRLWLAEAVELSSWSACPDISFHVLTCCNSFGTVDRKIGMDTVFHLKFKSYKYIKNSAAH